MGTIWTAFHASYIWTAAVWYGILPMAVPRPGHRMVSMGFSNLCPYS